MDIKRVMSEEEVQLLKKRAKCKMIFNLSIMAAGVIGIVVGYLLFHYSEVPKTEPGRMVVVFGSVLSFALFVVAMLSAVSLWVSRWSLVRLSKHRNSK